MSNTFHPGVTRHMAEQAFSAATQTTGEPTDGVAVIERAMNRHACSAAGICGNDPSSIYRSVWYRSDGWGHGGSAITWQERAEELEAELSVKNALLDRAKHELEEIWRDQPDEIGGAAVNRITKLLTDIERL